MSDKTTETVESRARRGAEALASAPKPAEPPESDAPAKKSGGGLGGKVLAELQEIAADLKIDGASGMRKGELIDAIKAARGDAKPGRRRPAKAEPRPRPPETSMPSRPSKRRRLRGTDEPTGGANQGGNRRAATNGSAKQPGRRRRPGRRRNRRGRNRGGNRGRDGDPVVTDDDVLVPAAGILDILDNYAFVRTTGYIPSESDVYVSLSMVKKWGLRKGDAIVGQVRQPREGERKEKFNPMVRVDTVNGMTIDDAKKRVEFANLTPLYPTERLRLEGQASGLTGRVIDLVAPIGKGQRGLIVSPPKAGKTMIMQQIANAITENNPEVHLMVVLVDERPEEVTDFQRTRQGRSHLLDVRPSGHRPHHRRRTRDRAGQAARRTRPRRSRAARRHHPPRPRLQPGCSGVRPDHVRRCRLLGALPAEEVLRRRAQHRRRRLADDHRHRARRDRLAHGRSDLRGVQGHRQHGAAPASRVRRQAHLPGHRRARRRARAARNC